MKLIKAQLSNQCLETSGQDLHNRNEFGVAEENRYQNESNCPIFKPAKIIDYKHARVQSFEEQLMEFRVKSVIDYNHKTTPKLQEFIRDVNVTEILKKQFTRKNC